MHNLQKVSRKFSLVFVLLSLASFACKGITPSSSGESSPSGGMPDLIVYGKAKMPGANGCAKEYLPLVSRICVQNQGSVPVGVFILQAGEGETWRVDGLDAGEEICYESDTDYSRATVTADVENDVVEADENNNTVIIPIPTQPVICTPESEAGKSILPDHLQIIAPENAANITEVANWQANDPLMDLAWSPDGEALAVAHANGVSIYNRQTLELALAIDTGYQITALAFSPDGSALATGSYDGNLTLWDAANGTALLTLAENLATMDLSFSPDGALLLSGGWYTGEAEGEGVVMLWDVSSGQELRNLGEFTKGIGNAAISPAGDWMAWGGEFSETVSLWDLNADAEMEPLNIGPGVYGLAFSPVEGILAAGSGDGSVKEWDITSNTLLQTFQIHQDWIAIRGLAFFPLDGSILAVGSENGDVKLWYTADNFELASLGGHSGELWGLAFSPDGTLLATASQDGAVRLWGVAP